MKQTTSSTVNGQPLSRKDFTWFHNSMSSIYGYSWISGPFCDEHSQDIWFTTFKQRGLMKADLARGLKHCATADHDFPPNLPKFISYCQFVEEQQPDLETAYMEAATAQPGHQWSNALVYYSVHGYQHVINGELQWRVYPCWWEIKNETRDRSFSLFKQNWKRLTGHLNRGGQFVAAKPLPTPKHEALPPVNCKEKRDEAIAFVRQWLDKRKFVGAEGENLCSE